MGHKTNIFWSTLNLPWTDNFSLLGFVCVLHVAAEWIAMNPRHSFCRSEVQVNLAGPSDLSLRKLQRQAAFSSGHLSDKESASKLTQVVEVFFFFFFFEVIRLSTLFLQGATFSSQRLHSAPRGCPLLLEASTVPYHMEFPKNSTWRWCYFIKLVRRVSRANLPIRWNLLWCNIKLQEWPS